MPKLRFATAREVFDALPDMADDLRAAPTHEPPVAYIGKLARSETPEDAITFSAYVLGRREAVWWACQCVRGLLELVPGDEDAWLRAAEGWVREPEEERRREALALGMPADKNVATVWLALAAAWSGGSIVAGPHPVPTNPHLTPKAARAAILIALARIPIAQRAERLKMCIDAGLGLMQEEARGGR